MIRSTILASALLFLARLPVNAQIRGTAADVQHYTFNIRLSDQSNSISGRANIVVNYSDTASVLRFDLSGKDSTGKGMSVNTVTENGIPLKFRQDSNRLLINVHIRNPEQHTYMVDYQGVPADGLIISTNRFGHRTFFGDNWPNRAHCWLPCVDNPADKATVDFIVTAPSAYQVIANGAKISEVALGTTLKQTHWQESQPLPTKVMVIGAASFAIEHTGDVGTIPVYTYVFPENKAAGFRSYAPARKILSYYVDKLGPYAFEKLANVQSKTIFGGMENASCIFYSESSVGDKFAEELLAHEIAHQWFGDAVTEKSFNDLWLSEGFATFMTNVYLADHYGQDTLRHRLLQDRKAIFRFEGTHFGPVADTVATTTDMSLLNPNAYQKGGWVLHMLRHQLGDQVFWQGMRQFYGQFRGRNADTRDFQRVMEQVSGNSLAQFFNQWIYTPGHIQLSCRWHYDTVSRSVYLEIGQVQSALYQATVDCLVSGELHRLELKDRLTAVQIAVPEKPTEIVLDPDVNLLGEFEINRTE